jgi:Flp pilus assembly protein TadG
MLGRRLLRDCSAAAAAEVALITPFILALMFGSMELGYYFYSEHVVVKAVRDGARFASRTGFENFDCTDDTIDPTTVGDIQRVTRTNQVDAGGDSRLHGWTDDSTVTVTMTCDTSGDYGSFYAGLAGIPQVKVTASVPYISLFSLLGFNTVSLKMTASSQAVVMGI